MTARKIRRYALYSLIAFDVAMLVFWALAAQWIFFWVFIGINVCVIVGELIAVVVYDHTLSKEVGKALDSGSGKRLFVYGALICLGLAIGSLIIHLGVA